MTRRTKLSAHLQSYEQLQPSKDVTNAYNDSSKPAASPRVEVEITPETKPLPPLPSSLNASSEDEERIERLIPDEGMAPKIEDAGKQESEGTKRWELEEKMRLILEILKEGENKSEELAEYLQQRNAHERNRRNALIGSSKMTTSTVVQEILNISITNKYGPDYSRPAAHYGPVHDRSQHRTHNETYTDHGQYVGTSDGKTTLRAPFLDGTR